MKVKYLLALALSHHAELLILDEPTSGLTPYPRGAAAHFPSNREKRKLFHFVFYAYYF